ncbi:ABC transporter permease [uncultured Paludibaculum sp.]|uniref:ABC transporter permease n=1 Tax=uncultured Paludibaculum sp. TaxID=1765020 RepID=UPI002AABF29B|nr:ABC transporter permease [uncultured Paludibaculum sp.]
MKSRISLLRSKWRALWGKRRLDQEFSDELAAHLEMLTAEFQAKGMGAADAARAARLRLGYEESLKETNRDQRGWPLAESILQDVRYTLRAWRRNPAFALAAIATLALGIGANSSVFTFLTTIGFRTHGGPGDGTFAQLYPQRLVAAPNGAWEATGDRGLSYEEFAAFRQARSLRALNVWSGWRPAFGDGDTSSEPTRVEMVSYDALEVMGVRQPLLGRWFTREECEPGAAGNLLLVTEHVWRTLFGSDKALVGRTLRMEGHTFSVIGVLPDSFTGSAMGPVDFVAPVSFQRTLSNAPGWTHDQYVLEATGLLRPGASREQLHEELNAIARQFDRTNPRESMDVLVTNGAIWQRPFLRSKLVVVLPMLQGAMVLVLLIACSNVASLLLSRAAVRQREVAVRLSLGAGRGRLLRQLLTESLLLSACAGLCSLWLAVRLPPLLSVIIPSRTRLIVASEFHLDPAVLGYTAAAALLAGLLAGLAPAFEALRLDLSSSLKGTGSVWSGRRRFRGWLVSVQVAASLTLLLGSGLLLRAVESVRAVGSQFRPETLLVTDLWLGGAAGRDPALTAEKAERVRRRAAELPGAQFVSLTDSLPMRSGRWRKVVLPGGALRSGEARLTDAAYFPAMGLALQRGRVFTQAELARTSTEVWPVVLAQHAAQSFFPAADPLGRRVEVDLGGERVKAEVIGVVASTGPIPNESPNVLYLPVSLARERAFLLTRFSGDELALRRTLQRMRMEFDPGLVRGTQPLSLVYEDLLSSLKPVAGVVAAISVLAMVLAMVGIYGVLAFAVSQRTRELGIRLALGARSGEVSALMMKAGLKPVLAGLVVGLPVAAGVVKLLSRFTAAMGVGAWDGRLYAMVLLVLLGSAALSMLLPSIRAGRVDPLRALREE